MALLGIGCCILFWIIEAAIHVFVLHEGDFIDQLFSTDPNEMWMRLIIFCILVLFGIYAQFSIKGRRQAEQAIQKAHDELEKRVEDRTCDLMTANNNLAREIETRTQAEETLEENQARYRALFENLIDGIAVYEAVNNGEDFVFVDFNKAAEKISRITRDAVLGESLLKTFPDVKDFGLFEVFQRVWRSGQPERFPIAQYKDKRISHWTENFVHKLPSGEIIAVYSDETERKQAEVTLQESEERFRGTFEQAAVGIAHVGPKGQFIRINQRFCDIVGYTHGEMRKLTFQDITHPDDLEADLEHVHRVLAGKTQIYSMEKRYLKKDGSCIWVNLTVSLVRKSSGEPNYFISVVEDITRRKQAEEALQESEEKFSKAFYSSAAHMAISTLEDGRFLEVNDVFEQTFEYKRDEVIGKTSAELGLFADIKQRDTIKKMAKERGYVRDLEITARTKSGAVRNGLFSGSIIKLAGEPHWLTVMQDITERKQAEEALRESQEKFKSIFDDAIDGILLADIRSQMFVDCNKKTCEMLGYSHDEIKSLGVMDIHPQEDLPYVIEQFEKQAKGELTLARDIPTERKDGSVFYADFNSSRMKLAGKDILMGIFRDITDIKEMEEGKAKLEAQLQQAQKMESIGTLAGGIAHDFNNILTPIIVQTELSLLDLTDDSPIWFNLQEVMKAGHRAKDLVAQILAFSRKTEQQPIPLKITPIVREAIKLLRASLPTTIEIRFDLREGSDAVMADPTQIHQVLMNLCTNAGHAMREAGGILQVSLSDIDVDSDFAVKHADLEPGPYLKLTVSDTGHGISSEVKDRIFDPFFTTKDRTEGTGMGLSVVHGIISGYGGAVTVDSESGKGTIFNVFLPRTRSKVLKKSELTIQLPTGNERILVVDDEKSMVDTLKKILERLGYQVVERTSSIEALEAFRSGPDNFDLVITDMTMPNLTGDKLAQKLLAIRSDIPIILCTGFSERISKEKATEIGIKDFLMKPVAMSEMATTIRRVFDNMAG